MSSRLNIQRRFFRSAFSCLVVGSVGVSHAANLGSCIGLHALTGVGATLPRSGDIAKSACGSGGASLTQIGPVGPFEANSTTLVSPIFAVGDFGCSTSTIAHASQPRLGHGATEIGRVGVGPSLPLSLGSITLTTSEIPKPNTSILITLALIS